MSGNDALNVWLAEPKACGPRQGKTFAEMVSVLGRVIVKKIASRGMSSWVYDRAKRIARYTGDMAPEWVCQCCNWLMEIGGGHAAKSAMEAGIDAGKLTRLVREMKPLV